MKTVQYLHTGMLFIIINSEMLLEAGWIEPEDTTISEIIEIQTNKFCMFSLTCGNMNFDFIEIE